jgi:iron complex transport system substrate-binding protein
MKGTKILSLLLVAALVLCLAASGALGEAAPPVTVKDMKGREITLDAPATRIVALTAADCEILYALGAGDTLVGRGEYCEYPEQVLSVPSVQSGATTNIEQILALKPQIVLMNTMAQTKEQVSALEAAGIKVAVSEATNIAGVYTAIELIGALTGKTAEAAALVDSMKTSFEEISQKATGDGTKTVYFEVSPLQYGLWAAGSGTFMDELATMVGLRNAFADVQGWGEVSQEQVIERDPDYIVTVAMYAGVGPDPVEEIKSRAGWQDLKAVKNGAILNADSNEISLPGPRLVDAAETLYKFVYEPETRVPAE